MHPLQGAKELRHTPQAHTHTPHSCQGWLIKALQETKERMSSLHKSFSPSTWQQHGLQKAGPLVHILCWPPEAFAYESLSSRFSFFHTFAQHCVPPKVTANDAIASYFHIGSLDVWDMMHQTLVGASFSSTQKTVCHWLRSAELGTKCSMFQCRHKWQVLLDPPAQ